MKFTASRHIAKARQAGFSLVELSVAMAIIAVILVGALMGTRAIMLSNSVNNQIRDTAAVISKVQRQYAKQANTTGATTTVLGPLGIWPSERATAGTPWVIRGVLSGSSEFIFSNDAAIGSLPANGGFIYTLRGVQLEACGQLVSALDSVAFAIYTGATAAAPTSGATPTSTAVKAADSNAVDMTSLATACRPATGSAVDIAVVFRQ